MKLEEPKLESADSINSFIDGLMLEDSSKTFCNVKYDPVEEDGFGDTVVFTMDKCKVVYDISKYNKLVVKINNKDLPFMKRLDAKLGLLLKDPVNTYQSFLGKNGDCVSLKVNEDNEELHSAAEKLKHGNIVNITFSFSRLCKINKHTYASFELQNIKNNSAEKTLAECIGRTSYIDPDCF